MGDYFSKLPYRSVPYRPVMNVTPGKHLGLLKTLPILCSMLP